MNSLKEMENNDKIMILGVKKISFSNNNSNKEHNKSKQTNKFQNKRELPDRE